MRLVLFYSNGRIFSIGLLLYHHHGITLLLMFEHETHGKSFVSPDVVSQSAGFMDGQALRVDGGEPGGNGDGRIKSPLAPPFSKGGIEEFSPVILMSIASSA